MVDYKELYKQALEKVKQMVKDGHLFPETSEKYFPELKESEDERIRKEFCKDIWTYIPTEKAHKYIAWLEKQGEQKPANKVESNFREGDWVVYKGDICQIIRREEGCNKLVTNFGIEKELVNERNLSTARLWTIQDAKDGDVLVDCLNNILIYQEPSTGTHFHSHCYYNQPMDSFIAAEGSHEIKGANPATKEQRNTLEKAMTEKGCVFDFNKKELKKIEQKPNPYSGTSFEYNGHTWGMCARDNGVEILVDSKIKGRVFIDDTNAKEMFIKALERVEELNDKGYKLTDCDKNSWWEDFRKYLKRE